MNGVPRLALAALVGVFGCAAPKQLETTPPRLEALPTEELYRSGVLLLEQGELTRAEQYLASALRAGHDPATTMRAQLTATILASRLRSALTYAEPYLVEHPRDVALRQLVGSLYLALGELARAEQELAVVLRLNDESAEAHYLMAVVLERRSGFTARRNAHFARYLALAPAGNHAEEARAALEQDARSGEGRRLQVVTD
jgi:predicted Zn-dependent protease